MTNPVKYLYEIPHRSVLVVLEKSRETELIFHHPDGMYSYCTFRDSQRAFRTGPVHLAALTPVVLLDDGRYQVRVDLTRPMPH